VVRRHGLSRLIAIKQTELLQAIEPVADGSDRDALA
jgi:hypothetical protein